MVRFRGKTAVLYSAVIFVSAANAQIPYEGGWRTWNDQFSEKTVDEARTKGRKRAEAEYHDGWAEIELFGLWIGSVYVDEEFGLYRRLRGCVIRDLEGVESDAYNERIKELVARNGLPQKARDISERLNRLRKLMERKPVLTWLPVRWSKNNAKPFPTKFGPFEVVAEVYRPPSVGSFVPRAVSRVRIQRGQETIATVRVEEGRTLAVTLLPDLDIFIIKETDVVDRLIFLDTFHARIMWRELGLKKLIKHMLDAKQQTDAAPSAL